MLTGPEADPQSNGRRMRGMLLFAALICGASFVAVAQNTVTIETAALGMTGWRADPVVVDTAALGMTGWRTAPATVETAVLGMTGWRTAPMVVDTATLGMTGWRTSPVVVDTATLGMTGWRTSPVVVDTAALGMTGWRTAPERTLPLKVLSGTLDLRDPAGPACPRRAEAALSLKTNVAGPVPYSLDCTGGRSWSQTATAQETAPGTYLAVAVLPFSVEHKEQINCALKSRQSPPKIVALRGHAYDCAKTGPDRIVTPPPTGVPPRPGVVVDPPRPTCVGGRLLVRGTKGDSLHVPVPGRADRAEHRPEQLSLPRADDRQRHVHRRFRQERAVHLPLEHGEDAGGCKCLALSETRGAGQVELEAAMRLR